jgi:protein-L-isoaspartate(D-aspartate) O-methyltransferase
MQSVADHNRIALHALSGFRIGELTRSGCPMEEAELDIVRRAYAKQVLAAAGVDDPRVEAAFAAIRREDFLGSGPWEILRWRDRGRRYATTPSTDPVYVYIDDVIGILPERTLNNGQPSLHAALIASAAPQPGEHVVHIGTGTGYYTATFAELVGAAGMVTAVELDLALSARAAANLEHWQGVGVMHGDGTAVAFAPADVIYVNAGATRPADIWLDRLKEGGRLILPLTAAGFPQGDASRGAVFLIQRRDADFLARRVRE